MSPATEAFINRVVSVLAEVNAVTEAVTDSSEMRLAEAAIPGLAQIVADLRVMEGAVSALTEAVPVLETLNKIFGALHGPTPADGDELARLSEGRQD